MKPITFAGQLRFKPEAFYENPMSPGRAKLEVVKKKFEPLFEQVGQPKDFVAVYPTSLLHSIPGAGITKPNNVIENHKMFSIPILNIPLETWNHFMNRMLKRAKKLQSH
jgi:hypothetical protein